jgi:outer membrane protein assembly factor BamD|tara:strand:- start:1062 stop:1889 length:828 start_codon:yes stop_codon:yes gene_type:complete
MVNKIIYLFLIILLSYGCSKKDPEISKPLEVEQSFEVYKEALRLMNRGDLLFASRKFTEAETIMPKIEQSSKAALMSSYCLYAINFYPEAIESLERFIKIYPADKNIPYAHYLLALSYYEQILDKSKDIKPLNISKEKIEFFLEKFPDTEYALDLKFKLDFIIDQLAAKELYIAKYYINNQKWIPAINRLKIIVNNYDETIFIEEALHRLVEVYYNNGLEEEAKKTAAILGYNYNSSEWYRNSYRLLNKEYKIPQTKEKKKDGKLIKGIIQKLLK